MNALMNTGEQEDCWNMKQQITKSKRPESNGESIAEAEDEERQATPEVKPLEVHSQRKAQPELPAFTHLRSIGQGSKDERNRRPNSDKERY